MMRKLNGQGTYEGGHSDGLTHRVSTESLSGHGRCHSSPELEVPFVSAVHDQWDTHKS